MPPGSPHVRPSQTYEACCEPTVCMSPDAVIFKQIFSSPQPFKPTPIPPSKWITGNSQSFLTFL